MISTLSPVDQQQQVSCLTCLECVVNTTEWQSLSLSLSL
jgi:hypothetical protein